MTFERHVDVDWKGSVMEGKGDAKAGTGAFTLPVSFPSRIGDPGGKTSPEELMAAAHAACYAMALNGTIGRTDGVSVDRTVVRATVTADKGEAGIKILSSNLEVTAYGLKDAAVFSVFRRASEAPLYRIEKRPALARRQGAWAIISQAGMILRRGHELDQVLRFFEPSRLSVVE